MMTIRLAFPSLKFKIKSAIQVMFMTKSQSNVYQKTPAVRQAIMMMVAACVFPTMNHAQMDIIKMSQVLASRMSAQKDMFGTWKPALAY